MHMHGYIRKAAILAAMLSATAAFAQETPRWLRKNAISPDGEQIAFCYKGDLFTVSAAGGEARQITANEAYDSDPVWTPDGERIVFSSYREGSKDIFITSKDGGVPKRLTDYPGNETPLCVLPGGQVVFSAAIQPDARYGGFPGTAQLWQVGPEGGRPRPVTSLPVMALSVSPTGDVVYEDYKGYEDPLRKHHTSAVTRDIWLYRPAADAGDGLAISGDGTFRRLSGFQGEDRNPVFAADGQTYYYHSEKDGTFNVYRSSVATPGEDTQLTSFRGHPVRHLSAARNGTLCFSWNGDLYTLKTGGQPEKLAVTVHKDETENPVEYLTFNGAATAMAVSPDGKEVAIVIRGDVFVTSVEYKTTRRITNTPEQERGVSFSKDGRALYYASERDGHWASSAAPWKTRAKNCSPTPRRSRKNA